MNIAVVVSFILTLVATRLEAFEFHVALSGSDANAGSGESPFGTIQHAADVTQPGDIITIHAGVYRERISPPRGGESDRKRIVYQAAPGERVEITGSEIVTNWIRVQDDTWKSTLPNSIYGAFNSYRDLIHGDWFHPEGRSIIPGRCISMATGFGSRQLWMLCSNQPARTRSGLDKWMR